MRETGWLFQIGLSELTLVRLNEKEVPALARKFSENRNREYSRAAVQVNSFSG